MTPLTLAKYCNNMKDSSIDSRIPDSDRADMDAAQKVLDQHGAGATIDPSLKERPTDRVIPVNDKGIVAPDTKPLDQPKPKQDKDNKK